VTNSILIADDSEVIRRTLRNLIGGFSDMKVCGEAENGKEAIGKAHHLKPDLVVMDFSMPIMNGLDADSHLRKQSPKIPIVMLTMSKDKFLDSVPTKPGLVWCCRKRKACRGSRTTPASFCNLILDIRW
jgi:chemotaxis response regulator CheB